MDQATKINFKANLKYFKEFCTSQNEYIQRFKQLLNDPAVSDDEDMLTSFETDVENIQRLSKLILSAFDKINFTNQNLIAKIKRLNTNCRIFQSLFTATTPSPDSLSSINSFLFTIRGFLTEVNKMIDLYFRN